MFERLFQGALRLSYLCRLFRHQKLLTLQRGDALFVSAHDRVTAGIDDAIQKLIDLLLGLLDPGLQRFSRLCRLDEFHVPGILEHGLHEIEEPRRRLNAFQELLEVTFDNVTPDRLAITRTALRRAEIVRILFGLALRPACGQRLVAVVAEDEASQREIGVDVLARRSLGIALETSLNALEGFERDQPLMVSFAKPDAPIRGLDIARIDRAMEDIRNPLIADFAVRQVFRKLRLALQEALHFHLRFKASAGIALQRLLEDRRQRLIAHEQLAVAADPFVAIADRSLEYPVAVLRPGAHPIDRLFAVLFTLMLRHRRQHVLDQARVAVLAELDGRALELTTRLREQLAQHDVCFHTPREPADVIDDDDGIAPPVLAQPDQHGLHARPVGQLAGYVVSKDTLDIVFLEGRELTAAALLRAEPVAPLRLRLAGDPAVDSCRSPRAAIFLTLNHFTTMPSKC